MFLPLNNESYVLMSLVFRCSDDDDVDDVLGGFCVSAFLTFFFFHPFP